MQGRHATKDVFLRINNRKSKLVASDMRRANYPEVHFDTMGNWRELHNLCRCQFIDGQGRYTYTWFGHFFFFTNEEDAHLFRSLILMV
ncbi:hypothetical protein [Brucella anthropi]|uniref:hypothetical protein n=1 Tax=Brucella anthropi TaxID=529 RepID=UPI00124E7F6A|nr:hypothetical protein [Brucella anthropi]KAB2751821.1 hypothetical protein F9L05_01415 [Brucella anthropi]